MKNVLKYGVVPIAIFSFLLVLTVVLLPVLINVQKFVPAIEEMIGEASGRKLSLGPEFSISFFPSFTVSFTDLKLGNPPGFMTDGCVKIDSFEARIKLLPLLKKEIQVSRFVVGGLEVNLETNGEGKSNWQFIRSMFDREASANPLSGILRGGVSCTLLAVTDGEVNWIDRTKDVRHTVADLMVLLNDVTVDAPISVDFKASYDGRPIALEGKIGPFRAQNGDEPLPVDAAFRIADTVKGRFQGKVENRQAAPVYEAAIELAPFSPRKLFASLDIPFPLTATDPDTFQSVALSLTAKAGRAGFSVEKGTAQIDDTTLVFSLQAKNFEQPELELFIDIDHLDLDRYLPVAIDNRQAEMSATAEQRFSMVGDLRVLRNAALGGAAKIQSLKIHGGTVSDIDAQFNGRDGILTIDHAAMTLYGGQLQASLTADLLAEMPKVRVALQSQDVQAGTLLHDFAGQEFLSGTLATDIVVGFSGETFDTMKKSLSGEATVSCRDGALTGVDLFRLMNNRKGGDDGAEDRGQLRTEFSELKSVMALENGLLKFRETVLASPAGTLVIGGTADLAGRQWDLLVMPETMQAKQKRGPAGGNLMPLTVTGPFNQPELKIDNRKHPLIGRVETNSAKVANLVDEQIPSPVDDDVKNLVGKALVDPAIVVQRFRLQPEIIMRSEAKKHLPVGSGRIRIGPLQEESSVR